jgi:hypothetical protein
MHQALKIGLSRRTAFASLTKREAALDFCGVASQDLTLLLLLASMPREKLTDKPSSVVFPHQRTDISLTRLKASIPCRQLKAFLSKNRKTVPRQNKRVVYLGVLLILSLGASLDLNRRMAQEQLAVLLRSSDDTPPTDLLSAAFSSGIFAQTSFNGTATTA